MRVLVRLVFAAVVCSAFYLLAQSPDTPAKTMPPEMPAQVAPAIPASPQPAIVKRPGQIVVPDSSIVRAEDAGLRMHTNVEIFVPAGRPLSSIIPDDTFAETPASLGCVYRVGPIYNNGCTPSGGGTNHPTGVFYGRMRAMLDEPTLKGMATMTKGEYFHAQNAQELTKIYQQLTTRLQKESEETEISAFFVAAAMFFLVLAAVLSLLWFHHSSGRPG